MVTSPDIAALAALIGDRARAAMLTQLMGGQALTATELARAAGVTKQTASAHLGKLVDARLVSVEPSGRCRYFRLADPGVGAVIEGLMVVADRVGARQVTVGPPDPALRKARVCYDHLAGELGVLVFDRLTHHGWLRVRGDGLALTEAGERFCRRMGIDVADLERSRRPLGLPCLDWSVRRHHVAGALGAAILNRCLDLGWARRRRESRVLVFSAVGERALRARLEPSS